MSPTRLTPHWHRARFGISLALGVALFACGGNPTSAPGQGAANLPPQTNPGIKDANADKSKSDGPKRTLKGTVLNAVTGEPVDRVTIYVEGIVTTVVSTPIPAAPTPGPDDKPGGAEAGPLPVTGGMQVADLPDPADPKFGQIGSPPPGAPAVPGATSPSPTTSPRQAGAPSAAPAGAASSVPNVTGSPAETPNPLGTPLPLTTYKPDSKGNFELKDLPEGAYSFTLWAPGYEAQTFQGNLPNSLDVKLRPLDVPVQDQHTLKGVVRQANNQPAGEAEVEVSSLEGRFPGQHTRSDGSGAFNLDGLVSGNYALAGWTSNLEGDITTFALIKEVPVSLGREKRTVSPTLVLRAITSPLLFAGTIGSAKDAPGAKKGLKGQSVRALVNIGDSEIPIASSTVGKDGYFRLRLPNLPEGASYHLVASGQGESGQTTYVHKYNLNVADPKLEVPLPDAPTVINLTNPGKAAAFSWEPVGSDVAAYRVAIESLGQNGDTVWEGWTSGTAIRLPAGKDFNLLHEGESYRYTLTAIRLADKGKVDLPALAVQPWESSGMTRPATFEVQKLKPGQKNAADSYKPLAVPEAPTSGNKTSISTPAPISTASSVKPKPKATKKPAGKASPKPSRIKPIDNI